MSGTNEMQVNVQVAPLVVSIGRVPGQCQLGIGQSVHGMPAVHIHE